MRSVDRRFVEVDRASITYAIPQALHMTTRHIWEGLLGRQEIFPPNAHSELFKNYSRAAVMPLANDCELKIQLDPRTDATGYTPRKFMRLEWNPASSNRNGGMAQQRIYQLLEELVPRFNRDHFLDTATITRLDLTFDVHGVPLDSLCITAMLSRTYTGRYEYGARGALNSVHFGRPDSDQYLLVYDKNLERAMAKNGGIARLANGVYVSNGRVLRSCTRFELRLHDIGTFERLNGLSNPYERYSVSSAHNRQPELQSDEMRMMLDSVQLRGAHAALSRIRNRRLRTQLARALHHQCPASWWDSARIWSEVPVAIDRAFN
jgi:hypothetical protein